MRLFVAAIVFVAVVLLVGLVATLITQSVGGGPSMAFVLGMLGGPIASIASFAVYTRGSNV